MKQVIHLVINELSAASLGLCVTLNRFILSSSTFSKTVIKTWSPDCILKFSIQIKHKKSHIFIVSKEIQIRQVINLQNVTKFSLSTEVLAAVIEKIVKERQIYRYKNKSRDIYNSWRLVRTIECTWDLYAIGNFSNNFMNLGKPEDFRRVREIQDCACIFYF